MGDAPASLLVSGGTLIDGTGGAPLANAALLIQDGRIQEVGPATQISAPEDARRIDATGKAILPGLWDSHVHYRDWMAELYLSHGVTTIFDVGNQTEWILAQRDGVEKGKIHGPRILACGEPIGNDPQKDAGEGGGGVVVHGPDEARAEARARIAAGVNGLKVWAFITPEQIKAVAEEAHAAGLKVIGHLTISARDAVNAGLDCLAHITGVPPAAVKDPALAQRMIETEQLRLRTLVIGSRGVSAWGLFALMEEDTYDELIDFLLRHNVFLECDFVYRWPFTNPKRAEHEFEDYKLLTDPRLSYVPEVTRQRNLRAWSAYRLLTDEDHKDLAVGYRKYQEFIRRFNEAGGSLLVGTDTSDGRMAGLGVHREMEYFVRSGLTPMQAIMAATSRPAQFAGRTDLGTLQKGKVADLIVVDGDPIRDITETRKVEHAVKAGRPIEIGYHSDYSNPIPRPFGAVMHAFPLPRLHALSPGMVEEGSGPCELRLEGEGFVTQSVVELGGVRLKTQRESATLLTAVAPAHLLARVGTLDITVRNPEPVAIRDPLHDDARSNPKYLMVRFR